MINAVFSHTTFLRVLVIVIAILTIPTNIYQSVLPVWNFWGLDFHNLWTFHHCELKDDAYSSPFNGSQCGDTLGRRMNYPPLMYWSFYWTRFLSFDTAIVVWVAFIVVALSACLLVWSEKSIGAAIMCLLLHLHFPALFTFERGNNDIWIVILWTSSFLAYRSQMYGRSGFVAGMAIAAKLYPLIACAVIFLGSKQRWKFAISGGIAVLSSFVIFNKDWIGYINNLKYFVHEIPYNIPEGHGLPMFFPSILALPLGLTLIAAWARSSIIQLDLSQQKLIFAGSLAISTYMSTTSIDYNLITAYPLMIVLFDAILTSEKPIIPAASTIALLVTVTGSRWTFIRQPRVLVILEVIVLFLIGIAASRTFFSNHRPPAPSIR